jgi:hypothetical protein
LQVLSSESAVPEIASGNPRHQEVARSLTILHFRRGRRQRPAPGRAAARAGGANGVVEAAVADGRGGWFVGGSFTRLCDRRHVGIAHLLRGGTVDESWELEIPPV